jgi:hypothetical protein
MSVASSSDGAKLVVVAYGDYIYTSADSGVTWRQAGTSQNWRSVASSSDGTKLVAVSDGSGESGYIYTSADSGATWTQTGTPQGWTSVASALFHFDGTERSTNLVDSSATGKVATITGNPVISTAQSKFGGASLYINGNSNSHTNYVVIRDAGGGADLTFNGDFTIDWWQYTVAYTDAWGSIVGDYSGDPSTSASLCKGPYGWCSQVAQVFTGNAATPALGIWQHAAIVRSGSTMLWFINGVLGMTATTSATIGGFVLISADVTNSDNGDFNGYIDELRVVKGVAVWTSNFTPPTAPYTATEVLPVDGGTPDLPPATPDSGGDERDDAASDATGVSCGTSVCTGGGCCVANTCVANGATCSSGGTCAAGSCGSSTSLSVSPLSLDFGSVTTGQSSSAQSFTITNTGQQTSGAITVMSDNADFGVQTGGAFDCVSSKTTLAPNTACTVHVVFSPKLAVAVTGTVTVSATPGASVGVSVSGTSACSADYLNDGTGTCVPLAGVVGGGGTCAAGPDGWCWWTFVHPSTTATWVAPSSASSVHVSLTAEPASINLGNAGIGFTFAADNPLIDLTRFDRIVFTATASMGFEFNVASSGTAGCLLNFAGSGTEQTYTLNFSECTRWSSDSTKPAFSLASVWYIHWDTLWGTASSLDIEIVPDILFCLGTQCTANPLSP